MTDELITIKQFAEALDKLPETWSSIPFISITSAQFTADSGEIRIVIATKDYKPLVFTEGAWKNMEIGSLTI